MTPVEKYINLLCMSLVDDYKHYSIKSCFQSIQNAVMENNKSHVDYYQDRINEQRNGENLYEYIVESGKKYHKVIMVTCSGNRSVHCFVDKNNGDVYKAASWSKPARGVRYNLLNDQSREDCLMRSDWSGSYLYK